MNTWMEEHSAIFDRMIEGCHILSHDWKYLYVNEAGARFARLPKHSLIGNTVMEVHRGVRNTELFHELSNCMTNRVELIKEFQITYPDHSTSWFELHIHPIPAGLFITSWDTTERNSSQFQIRQQKQLIQSNEALLNTMIRGMKEACFILSSDWKFIFVNDRCESLFPFTKKQMIGNSIWDVFHRLLGTPMEDYYRRVMKEKISFSFEAFSPIAERWLDIRLFPTDDGLVAFLLDIQKRKLSEIAQSETEEQFRQLAENINEVFWLSDLNTGNILYISPEYEAIWGRSAESLKKNSNEWIDAVHPEYRTKIMFRAKTKQITGEYDEEYRIIRPDGTERWIHDTAFPVRDKSGNVYRIAGVAEDITDRKQAEENMRKNVLKRRELEKQLIQSQKMESLGTLASGIAHDFNNILAIIMGHASLNSFINQTDPHELEQSTQAILQASERGASLVKQLLTFARKNAPRMTKTSPNSVVEELANMLKETLPRNIEIELKLDRSAPVILVDPSQLHQIILNLSVNARDAMPNGGNLSFSSTTTTREKIPQLSGSESKFQDYAVIEISDTGMGMDQDTMRRIFEPFFTTKGVGKGTGLGLSVVYSIVANHDGILDVRSEIGLGTTFSLFFPICEKGTAEVKRPEMASIAGGQETILIVEDEDLIRDALAKLLNANGYKVMSAKDGSGGAKLFSEQYRSIDLVILDMGLPGLLGDQVYVSMRKICDSIPVIAASGYLDPALTRTLQNMGLTDFVHKPYAYQEMLRTIRNVLDRRTRSLD